MFFLPVADPDSVSGITFGSPKHLQKRSLSVKPGISPEYH